MKKILLIMCVCALLVTGAACGKKNQNELIDGTGVVSDTNGKVVDPNADVAELPPVPLESAKEGDPVDLDGDGVSDGKLVSGETGYEPIEEYDEQGNPVVVANPDAQVMETQTISEGGTDAGLWPKEDLPEDVPAYTEYSKLYTTTVEENDKGNIYFTGVDTTEEEYEKWLTELETQGYRMSNKISGFWGNGKNVLDIMPEKDEETGEFYVSIDVYECSPVVYPETVKNVFPEFTTQDSTLFAWDTDEEAADKTFKVQYVCGSNFDVELAKYKETLAAAGFTVTDSQASINKDGKEYIVRYGDALNPSYDMFEYVYYA